jgi:hypothetical protein
MIEYFDGYLAPLIDKTPEFETRAVADVAELGTFPDPWPDKLAVLRAYILVCLENSASADDVFVLKLKQYQKEFDFTLRQAQAAVNLAAETPTFALTVELERN